MNVNTILVVSVRQEATKRDSYVSLSLLPACLLVINIKIPSA